MNSQISPELIYRFCRPTARVGNFAVLKEQESVAAFLHKLWVVGDDELRFPHLREAPDILCHALHVAVVETAGGFVVEDNILCAASAPAMASLCFCPPDSAMGCASR